MLDQYNGSSNPGQTSPCNLSNGSSEKKFVSPKVDQAAHMLASCMKAVGCHKLRKSSEGMSVHEVDLPLPPPPPELLQRNASWTGSLPSNQPHDVDCAVPKFRPAPVVPKRDPDTKLSTSSLSDASAVAVNCQCGREAMYESGGGHFLSYGQKRHPESGYITPDQETADSVFFNCLEKSGALRMSQPVIHQVLPSSDMESLKKNDILPAVVFPQPPDEFGDCQSSASCCHQIPSDDCSDVLTVRNSNFSDSDFSVRLRNSGDLDALLNESSVLPRQYFSSIQRGQQFAACQKPPGEQDSRHDHMQSTSFSVSGVPLAENGPMSSVSPYLACIVPPPPPMERFLEVDQLNSNCSIISTAGIIPCPPPMHSIMPSDPPSPSSSSSKSIVPEDIRFTGSEELPSPSKLPPPPTFPKQPKKSLQPLDSSTTGDSTPNALPFKVNLKSVSASKNLIHPAVESDGAAVYAVPLRLDFKYSTPAAVNSNDGSAGSAIGSNVLQNLFQSNSAEETTSFAADKNPGTWFHQRRETESVSDFAPPPPPPPPPPPVSVDQKFSSPSTKTRQSSPPATAPAVPLKSWSAVQPPPPLPATELDPDDFGRGSTISGLAFALQSVRFQPTACTTNERFYPSTSNPLGDQEALINQIQTGIQLKKSVDGARIRKSSPTDLVNVTNRSLDTSCTGGDNSVVNGVEPSKASGNSPADDSSDTLMNHETVQHIQSQVPLDVTTLPGYQEIPPNCPAWKIAVIEKKNKILEEDAMREILMKKQEEERWRDIPEWKRSLIIEKEKKKQEELTPHQAERKRHEGEIEKLQSLPEWKRNLIIKKRGDNV